MALHMTELLLQVNILCKYSKSRREKQYDGKRGRNRSFFLLNNFKI
jgi:hypothetical protein